MKQTILHKLSSWPFIFAKNISQCYKHHDPSRQLFYFTSGCSISVSSFRRFCRSSWSHATPVLAKRVSHFTLLFILDKDHHPIYDLFKVFLYSLFFSDKEEWAVAVLAVLFSRWLCYLEKISKHINSLKI